MRPAVIITCLAVLLPGCSLAWQQDQDAVRHEVSMAADGCAVVISHGRDTARHSMGADTKEAGTGGD